MNKIEQFLNNAARHYYAGEPIISDEQFDKLADSIGYSKVGSKQGTEKHIYPLYSLKKHYEDEGKNTPLSKNNKVVTTIKLDGAAVAHIYINGEYTRSLTRGNGIEATNITSKFLGSTLIPQSISQQGVVQVIGELVAPSHVENSRNYAAGALNLKDIEEFRSRAVTFFAYGVQPYITDTFERDMEVLKAEGFNTVIDPNLHEVYPSDGLVIRVTSNKEFEELGFTAHHPNGAYALKERQPTYDTILLDVEWATSKTGRVTPVAILEPIKIGDKVVTRATLNNPGFIEAMDLYIGDTVAVRLAGMIIPEISHKVQG